MGNGAGGMGNQGTERKNGSEREASRRNKRVGRKKSRGEKEGRERGKRKEGEAKKEGKRGSEREGGRGKGEYERSKVPFLNDITGDDVRVIVMAFGAKIQRIEFTIAVSSK